MWKPLEANPVVLKDYLKSLGGPDSAEFYDMFSTEDWALSMLPTGVDALLLVYSITPKSTSHQASRDAAHHRWLSEDEEAKDAIKSVWFTQQTVGNACGTVALLHVFGNVNRSCLDPEGYLHRFFAETELVGPEERAKLLEKSASIEKAHQQAEVRGESKVPEEGSEDVNEHFVAFVDDGKFVVELDGRKQGPLLHKKTALEDEHPELLENRTFIKYAAHLVRKNYMDVDPDTIHFTMIAVRTGCLRKTEAV